MVKKDLSRIKIVAMGDSLTFGFPYMPECSWVAAVEKMLCVPIYNKGINGDTTGQMLQRFERDCLALEPSYVIITGGSNDAFARKDAEEVVENIHKMAEQALQRGVKPIIGLPPPMNPPSDEKILSLYRAEMQGIADEKGIAVINFYKCFLTGKGNVRTELFADGAHPNLEGYKLMTDTAFHYLKKLAV